MNTPLQIQIRKPKTFKRRYEFFTGEKEVAVLDYPKTYCKQATAINEGRKWQFTRKGFWKQSIEISAEQSPYTKTSIRYGWNYKLNFRTDNGKEYWLKKTSLWKNTWAWVDERNNPVIEIKSCQLSKSRRGYINIVSGNTSNKDFFLMMLIGWYQVIAYEDQAGAAAAAA